MQRWEEAGGSSSMLMILCALMVLPLHCIFIFRGLSLQVEVLKGNSLLCALNSVKWADDWVPRITTRTPNKCTAFVQSAELYLWHNSYDFKRFLRSQNDSTADRTLALCTSNPSLIQCLIWSSEPIICDLWIQSQVWVLSISGCGVATHKGEGGAFIDVHVSVNAATCDIIITIWQKRKLGV